MMRFRRIHIPVILSKKPEQDGGVVTPPSGNALLADAQNNYLLVNAAGDRLLVS